MLLKEKGGGGGGRGGGEEGEEKEATNDDRIHLDKSNILLLGPTGSGEYNFTPFIFLWYCECHMTVT